MDIEVLSNPDPAGEEGGNQVGSAASELLTGSSTKREARRTQRPGRSLRG